MSARDAADDALGRRTGDDEPGQPMSTWTVLHGTDAPPPARTLLRAGPLSLALEDIVVRWVRLDEHAVLDQVYVAVRPLDWSTVAPVISNLRVDDRGDAFEVIFTARHRQAYIDFSWQGRITGAPDGTLAYEMDGTANRAFRAARIGFCVLHPMACAGRPVELLKTDGPRQTATFPEAIAPHQPFRGLRGMTHPVTPEVRAEVRLKGETFETEDHRNWTDASFKTYCPPLTGPYPAFEFAAGQKVVQSVTLRLLGRPPQATSGARPLTITLGDRPLGTLPRLGLGMASHGRALTGRELDRLRALHLAHLRVELHLAEPDAEDRLRLAGDTAVAIGAGLEVVLFLTADADLELERLAAAVGRLRAPVAAWVVLHEEELTTTEKWVRLARPVLNAAAPSARFGTGTNAYFTELNRFRPPLDGVELVAYSLNPQVHNFDDASLTENLPAQRATVESARRFVGPTPIAVTPVTLRPRLQPNGAPPEPTPVPGQLPSQVDVRQMSVFGAAWTAGSLKHLGEAGAWSVTYFETTGWRGVMETEDGPPLADRFPSRAGDLFPLFHVLADVGEWAGAALLPARSSQPLRADAMALRRDGSVRALVASFAPERQEVTLDGLPPTAWVRTLDERTAEQATRDPHGFRRDRGRAVTARQGRLTFELPPYAVTRIDGPAA